MMKYTANLFTAGNLLCGLFSILCAYQGSIVAAAWLIMLAAVLDAFDGKAARYFGTESRFGLYFDSLADMVSFGVAPAVTVCAAALSHMGPIGLVATVLSALLVAIRLARFTAAAARGEHDFEGLSSPLHGSLLASFMVMNYSVWGAVRDPALLLVLLIVTSLLAVSRMPFPGLPRFTLRESGYNLLKLVFLSLATGFALINPTRHAFPAIGAVVVAGFVAAPIRLRFVRATAQPGLTEKDTGPVGIPRGHR